MLFTDFKVRICSVVIITKCVTVYSYEVSNVVYRNLENYTKTKDINEKVIITKKETSIGTMTIHELLAKFDEIKHFNSFPDLEFMFFNPVYF